MGTEVECHTVSGIGQLSQHTVSVVSMCEQCHQRPTKAKMCKPCSVRFASTFRKYASKNTAPVCQLCIGIAVNKRCAACKLAYNRQSRAGREIAPGYGQFKKDQEYTYRYGVSLADAESLLVTQGGGCAICSVPLSFERRKRSNGFVGSACVDHSHGSGKVRGILCTTCNSALGKFRDSPELLTNAIKYLET